MRTFKKSSRIVAVILSALMILSATPSFNFFAKAQETAGAGVSFQGKVERTNSNAKTNNELFAGSGLSLVKARPKTYECNFNSSTGQWDRVECDSENESDASFLADGDIESKVYGGNANQFHSAARKFAIKKQNQNSTDPSESDVDYYQIDGKKYAADIVHDLQKEEVLNKIIISHHPVDVNYGYALCAGHYYVYASKTEEDLFKDESIVYKNVYNHEKSFSQIFNFLDNTTVARYVAIRVFNPYFTNDEEILRKNINSRKAENAYIRMYEFNVFGPGSDSVENGDYPYRTNNVEYTYNDALAKENSLIKGKRPTKMFIQKGSTEYQAVAKIGSTDMDTLVFTDGDSETASEIYDKYKQAYKFVENSALLDDESKMYLQLNYKLEGVAKVSDLELFFHKTDDISSGHFKISVAKNEADLFKSSGTEDNPVYTTGDIYSICGSVSKVRFDKPKEGQYVGIRIICPVKKHYTDLNLSYMRLTEVSVYGTYSSSVGEVEYRYQIEGTTGAKSGEVDVVYTGNPDSDGKYNAGTTTATLKTVASIRDSAGVLHSFVAWKNSKGETIGEELELNLTLNDANSTVVTAIYGKSDKTVTLTFKNYWGAVIHTAVVPFGQYLPREEYEAANSKLGPVPGKEILHSEFSFGSRVASMPAWSEDIYNYAADANVTFTPKYVTAGKTYNVTLNGEPITDSEGNQIKNIVFDQKIELTNSSAGHWTVNDVPWADGNTFHAYVTENMEIKTQSGSATQGVHLAKNPVVSGSSAGFVAKLILPSGAIVQECGLLLVGGDSNVATITLDNAQQTIVSTKRSGNEFMITVNYLPNGVTRRARMYVKYKKNNISSTTTSYSNEVTLKMP